MVLRHTLNAAVVLLVSIGECGGDFVLDDFTDGFSLSVPNELGDFGPDVWTLDVGDLGARRWSDISDRRFGEGPSTLTFDAGESLDSVAVINVLEIHAGTGWSSFAAYYDFILPDQPCPTCGTAAHAPPFDFTENGTNNTVFIDFAFARGTLPQHIRLSAFTDISALTVISDIQESEQPFTIALPFSDFYHRVLGDSVPPADFSTTSGFSLSVVTSGLFDDRTTDPEFVERFTLGIDAIRFGAVPEPRAGVLTILVCWLCCLKQGRRRQRFREPVS